MISSSNTTPSLIFRLLGNAGSNYHPGCYLTANNGVYQAGAVAHFAYTELGLRGQQVVSGAWIRDGRPFLTTSGCISWEPHSLRCAVTKSVVDIIMMKMHKKGGYRP